MAESWKNVSGLRGPWLLSRLALHYAGDWGLRQCKKKLTSPLSFLAASARRAQAAPAGRRLPRPQWRSPRPREEKSQVATRNIDLSLVLGPHEHFDFMVVSGIIIWEGGGGSGGVRVRWGGVM